MMLRRSLLFSFLAAVARSNVLETDSHFFSTSDGDVLEPAPISAQGITQIATTIAREGFVYAPRDADLAALVADAASACGRAESCLRNRFSAASTHAARLEARVRELAAERFGGGVACAGVTVFGRPAAAPQNMHYDAVRSDGQACEDVTPSPPAYAVRAWLPLHVVDAAPLLLSNSTWLYDNACPRRALSPFGGGGGSSPTARVFSADEFAADCGADGCAYFHTLGMEPGELVFFRNGEVLHGTAAVGAPDAPPRVALSVDCEVPNDDPIRRSL